VSLATDATGAALDGRNDEYEAAVAALDENSVELAALIGSAYGSEAEELFLSGWREHIGFFVDYTAGSATGDEAARTKADADLQVYAAELGTFFNLANGLPAEDVTELVSGHVYTMFCVIDAQAAADRVLTFEELREATAYMQSIADPVAEGTVLRFQDEF
jgi:hypothetical protein